MYNYSMKKIVCSFLIICTINYHFVFACFFLSPPSSRTLLEEDLLKSAKLKNIQESLAILEASLK